MKMTEAQFSAILEYYRMSLQGLKSQSDAGSRRSAASGAQLNSDALHLVLVEAPLSLRPTVNALIDEYEDLRIRTSA